MFPATGGEPDCDPSVLKIDVSSVSPFIMPLVLTMYSSHPGPILSSDARVFVLPITLDRGFSFQKIIIRSNKSFSS